MKTSLNQSFVLTKLNIDQKPALIAGKLIFEPNPTRTPYIVFDEHREAPVGFGVKVSVTKKTYLIQRKVDNKVIKAKVGNISDFDAIDQARVAARAMAETMMETKRNPNVVAREQSAAEITMGECFQRYRASLVSCAEPPKENSLRVFDKATVKLKSWEDIKVKELSSQVILERFDEIAKKTRTTAEQTFRWANVAVKTAIAVEEIDANNANRNPMIVFNPFQILNVSKKYRTREQLEAAYEEKGIRKPLSDRNTLGAFLNAVWGRRKENRTGCDYLLLSVLWGTRKEEAASLVWREKLTNEEAKITSHVCLDTRKLFFFDTKN